MPPTRVVWKAGRRGKGSEFHLELFSLPVDWPWVNFGFNFLSGPQGRVWMTCGSKLGMQGEEGACGEGQGQPLPQRVMMGEAEGLPLWGAFGRGSCVPLPFTHQSP